MAVATTTAALIAAGIAAAGTGTAAGIQARSAGRATDAQRRATQEALAREERLDAEDKAQAEKDLEARKQRWYQWFQQYGDEGLQRYGMPDFFDPFPGAIVQRPAGGGRQGPPTPVPAPNPTPTAIPTGGLPSAQSPQRQTLGDLMGGASSPAFQLLDSQQPGPEGSLIPPTRTNPGSLGDLGGWNDWRRLGLGSN